MLRVERDREIEKERETHTHGDRDTYNIIIYRERV